MECGWRGSRRAPSNVVAGPDSVNVLATDVAPHNGRIKVRDQYANEKANNNYCGATVLCRLKRDLFVCGKCPSAIAA